MQNPVAFAMPQTEQSTPRTDASIKIKARNLNFYYGKFQAIKNVNLDIPQHQVTAFIGP